MDVTLCKARDISAFKNLKLALSEIVAAEEFDFELVIIDEAAQAIELSSLIPMKYRCRTCIMVGGELFPCTQLFRVITDVRVRSAAIATNSEVPRGL